jgi:uncharacterized protein (DUF2141 family)
MKKIFLPAVLAFIFNNSHAQTIKGKIYYDVGGSKRKTGIGLTVYLIPNNTQNAAIVSRNAKWEGSCNEVSLKSARSYKVTTTDKEGYYYFNNIPAGSYLVKVCKYYGGYYKFRVRTAFTGTLSLPDLEADPPVK